MSAIPGEMPRPESQQIRSRRFGGRFTPSRPPDRRADAEAAEVKRVAGFRKAYESGALQCGVGSSGALVTTAEGGLTTADLEEAAVLLPSGGGSAAILIMNRGVRAGPLRGGQRC